MYVCTYMSANAYIGLASAGVQVRVVFIHRLSIRSRLIRVIGLLSYPTWLLTAALTLATLLAVKTAMMKQSRGAHEHTSRQRKELEVLYDPLATNLDKGLSPAASRSGHVVEYVFASLSFADS